MNSDRDYDAANWFWHVPDTGEVYGSAERTFMAVDDPRVLAFEASGGSVTKIASLASLKEVLAAQAPGHMPVDLLAGSDQKRWELETGGIFFAGLPIETSRESQALIHGAFSLAQMDAEASFRFKAGEAFITLSSAQIIAIGEAVARHVQACFSWQADVRAGIEDGTIIGEADIHAAVIAFQSEQQEG